MTPKQERFVQEYLVDLNATQAAIRAGYSEKTAHAIGHENLSKPEIASAIEAAQGNLSAKVELTQETVIAGLMSEATKTGEGSSHSARVSAWGILAKYLGMLVDKQETGEPGAFGNLSPEQRKARVLQLVKKAQERKAG